MTVLGLVASGDRHTSEAAAAALRAGGNAFDAAVAAGFAAAVAEPCLTSLAGGGFLLARPATGPAVLFDFFVTAPGLGRTTDVGDLLAVPVHFGPAVQVFHAGPASVATPGVLAGYLHVHERLGRLDLAEVVGPAARLAREGFSVGPSFARLVALLEPLLTLTPQGRALFTRAGRPLQAGDVFANPRLGELLTEIGDGVVRGFRAADLWGAVTDADLAAYRVVEREPLRVRFRDAEVLTNPVPALGGRLLAHGLAHLEAAGPGRPRSSGEQAVAVLEALRAMTAERARLGAAAVHGTTHLSVADAEGNLASMTTSNGAGSGLFAGDTGVQLNNVLGEEDLHPAGLGTARPGARVGSMMAPTVLLRAGRPPVVLGSGGSERIRSTLLQLVVGLVDHDLGLREAVDAPRLHWDGERVQVEPGFPAEVLAALAGAGPLTLWSERDLYFGGAHAVAPPAAVAGDPRRNGHGLVVRA